MKIAYLIMCHKNPHQVERLVDRLLENGDHAYVHIDKKCGDFSLGKKENLYVLSDGERVSVGWAGISMMDAELSLLKTAIASGHEYGHYVLLSGEDYPLRDAAYISRYFASQRESNFIEILESDEYRLGRYKKRNEIIFPESIVGNSFAKRVIKNIYVICTGGYRKTFGVFKRENNTGLDFYYGSQWWALSREAAEWICGYLKEHPEVRTFFQYSLVPDECMMQSLIMKSPYRNSVKPSLTYVEWGDDRNHPVYLTKEKVKCLEESDKYLFARKIQC